MIVWSRTSENWSNFCPVRKIWTQGEKSFMAPVHIEKCDGCNRGYRDIFINRRTLPCPPCWRCSERNAPVQASTFLILWDQRELHRRIFSRKRPSRKNLGSHCHPSPCLYGAYNDHQGLFWDGTYRRRSRAALSRSSEYYRFFLQQYASHGSIRSDGVELCVRSGFTSGRTHHWSHHHSGLGRSHTAILLHSKVNPLIRGHHGCHFHGGLWNSNLNLEKQAWVNTVCICTPNFEAVSYELILIYRIGPDTLDRYLSGQFIYWFGIWNHVGFCGQSDLSPVLRIPTRNQGEQGWDGRRERILVGRSWQVHDLPFHGVHSLHSYEGCHKMGSKWTSDRYWLPVCYICGLLCCSGIRI